MSKGHVSAFKEQAGSQDILTELIREGARRILATALEAEVQEQLALLSRPMTDGKMNVVRNGYLPERGLLVFAYCYHGREMFSVSRFRACRGERSSNRTVLLSH